MGTFVKSTTKVKRRASGSGTALGALKRRISGGTAWQGLTFLKRRSGSGWVWLYSSPDVTASGGGAATGSGASSSGTVTKQVFATPGGTDSGSRSWLWEYYSGDAGITFNTGSSSSDQNPTMKRDFTGVSNGSTSAGVSAVWRVTQTDTQTGAQVVDYVTVGPLAWTNTVPAYTPLSLVNVIGVAGYGELGWGPGYCFGQGMMDPVTWTGGNGSVSISFARVGASQGISITNGSTTTPTFSGSEYLNYAGDTKYETETWQVTISDGVSSDSRQFSVSITFYCSNSP